MPTNKDPQDTTARLDIGKMQWGEPPPKHVDGPIMHDLVAGDLKSRSEFGRNKYGTNLRAFNGRDPLKDAYEEVLDLAVYLRQCLYERDKREEWMRTGERVLPPIIRSEQHADPLRARQATSFVDLDQTEVLKLDWHSQ